MNISEELQQHVADNPHIEKVYFTADGHHHFNVHEQGGKLYSRIAPVGTEEARGDYEITEILGRDEILGYEEDKEHPDEIVHLDGIEHSEDDATEETVLDDATKENTIEEPAVLVYPSADSPI